jgi:hypothetical protein
MKIQIDDLVRDATPEEAAAIEKTQADRLAEIENEKQTAIARAALLTKLGLTEDEARLLLY